MRISLVLLTYNWPTALERVLDSAARQSMLADEVIVTDDGSSEATRDTIARSARGFPCRIAHVWQDDLGFRAARARNRGIAASRGDYVVLIDGDMVLHRDFIADHAALALPGHSLQGSRLNASPAETKRLLEGGAPRFSPLMPGRFPPHRALRMPWLARIKARSKSGGRIFSCNMSAWREDLLRVNGFDERFEGYGGEDQELAKRMRHAGVRRRQLKFAGLAIHLFHTSRAPDDPNDMSLPANRMIAETLRTHAVRCERGVDGHLAEFAEPPRDLRGPGASA
ncbi:MAG TPA: glycosyltransferase family 2 protein [Rhodanobacteraceae bacterium]|nr:glycosyltransferase family 2 protein [Rhodanobacteraceae bacterium]